jgi:hypothetical protein
MSCNCQNTNSSSTGFPCDCDDFQFPPPLNIGAGLSDIPRQIASFPEFRRAMLYAIRNKPALDHWQATKPDDLGIMLLEMWAYICDSLSFYDKIIAEELYIGTASQRTSLRKLVALLGYIPAPAVAGSAKLAANASGRQPLKVPMGTAFRSGSFNGNPPQVFELDNDTIIDPFANSWQVSAPHAGIVVEAGMDCLLVLPKIVPKADALVLLVDTITPANNIGLVVKDTSSIVGSDGNKYTKITFTTPTNLSSQKLLSELQLMTPSKSANISSSTSNTIQLEILDRQIRTNDPILISGVNDLQWYSVSQITQGVNTITGLTSTVNGSTFTAPDINTPATVLTLDDNVGDTARGNKFIRGYNTIDWSDPEVAQLVIHYGFQNVGKITDEAALTLSDNGPFNFAAPLQVPAISPLSGDFLFQDLNLNAVDVTGTMNFKNQAAAFSLDANQSWSPDLILPVQVFGNILGVSRGQTVSGEILGDGAATQTNQSFKLQKKPLTYLPVPTALNNQGVKNTLTIYVNNILWNEVPSFYGVKSTDQVYIVRQNDDGDSLVIFGDGIRGQRLPTGSSNIVANYRYGAGKASPPAGSLNQIAKPLKGLQSVNNPTSASIGADAQTADGMRVYAPKTALILGRIVSIDDAQAVALAYPGVIAAQTEWRWEQDSQTALMHVWYIGDPTVGPNLYKRILDLADPTLTLQVDNATAYPINLSLSVDIDPRYIPADVVTRVTQTLLDPVNGLLTTGNLGIGNPIFRSQIFEAVLSVPGTMDVSGIHWGKEVFSKFAQTPGSGNYFDFTAGLSVNNS